MTQILTEIGTAIVLADTTDYSPGASAANNLGTRTDQIDLTSLADGACIESAKFDFGGGSALWASTWMMRAAIEPASAPTATTSVLNLYIGFSDSATAGKDNPGGLNGVADVAGSSTYQGYGADAASGLEALYQLTFIGSLVATADAAIFVQDIARFPVPSRYGTLVVHNALGVALAADAVEMAIRMTPIIPDSQEA